MERVIALLSAILVGFSGAASAQEKWRAFESGEQPTTSGISPFLAEDSMSAAHLYLVGGNSAAQQSENGMVYVVQGGAGTISVNEDKLQISDGDIIWVIGGAAHTISASATALHLLAIEPKGGGGTSAPDVEIFQIAELRAAAKPDENIWNAFLQKPNMILGLYLLPDGLDGDSTLTHGVDEINIVVKGEARFQMDDDEIQVRPGSIIWVQSGVGHWFDRLSEDFEVLILFHQKPA